jgi:hypothetical protein
VDEAEGAQLNLLFMGNSYTDYYNLPAFVSALAVADGYDVPLIVADLQGAQNVAYHLGEVTNNPQDNVAHPNIAGMTFDFAVIQGHSQEATSRRDPANDFIPNSIAWADAVRSAVAGADTGIVLYETWAREADHHFYPSSFANPAAMHLEIHTNNDIARAALTRTLAQLLRWSRLWVMRLSQPGLTQLCTTWTNRTHRCSVRVWRLWSFTERSMVNWLATFLTVPSVTRGSASRNASRRKAGPIQCLSHRYRCRVHLC